MRAPLTPARRRRALALMTDTCTLTRVTVRRQGGRDVRVEETIYTGRCKVQTYEAYESTPEAGGHTYTVQRYRLDLPVDAGPARVGDVAKVDRFHRPFRVAGEMDKTHLTAQRLPVDITAK